MHGDMLCGVLWKIFLRLSACFCFSLHFAEWKCMNYVTPGPSIRFNHIQLGGRPEKEAFSKSEVLCTFPLSSSILQMHAGALCGVSLKYFTDPPHVFVFFSLHLAEWKCIKHVTVSRIPILLRPDRALCYQTYSFRIQALCHNLVKNSYCVMNPILSTGWNPMTN